MRNLPAREVSLKWHKLLTRLPGYDPIGSAHQCIFDAREALQRLRFIESYCSHVKGSLGGKPFRLAPWERALIANMFGWKRPDGTRRYREAFIYVPRKNGKTSLAATIVLSVLFQDGEPGAECYSAAADREQATLVFSQVEGMIRQNDELTALCQIYTTARSVVLADRATAYKVISAEPGTKHGFNSHLVVIDELHAQPDRDLVDVLLTSTGSRSQPLIVYVTTSDFDRPSICNEKYDYACKVRDGIIDDPSFLPAIYEAPKAQDGKALDYLQPAVYLDKKLWRQANPNYGVSVHVDYLEREAARARETPSYLNTFLRLHLNVRTSQDVAWLDMSAWDNCRTTFTPEDLLGLPCYAGLDLASTQDLIALALIFPELDTIPALAGRLYAVLPFFWLPEETAKKRTRRSGVPYVAWAQQGLITLTPGDVADYDRLHQDIVAIGERYAVKEIAIDRWNATQLSTQLQADGFEMVGFGQGFASMSAPSKELERAIVAKQLAHNQHAVLRWNMSNVMAETDAAANLKPSKKKSPEKIDGVVASIMGIGRAMLRPVDTGSIYDSVGLALI